VNRRTCRPASAFVAMGLIVAFAGGCTKATPDSTGSPGSPRPGASGSVSGEPNRSQPTVVSASAPRAGTMHLVAVELQPEDPQPGSQLVLLANDTGRSADVNCWIVRSSGTGKSARIIAKRPLAPGMYLRLLPEIVLFDSADTLSLLDRRAQLVDQTPKLTDRARDDQLWFRQPSGTWAFGRGFRLPTQVDDGRLVTGTNTC
jgi:hypothetical protein